jgi:hypothetical protein
MRKLAFIALPLAAGALVVARPLLASPPQGAAGTEVTTSAATVDTRTADGNLIEKRLATRTLGGTFSGPMTSHLTRITFEDGSRRSEGWETCDPCIVDGRVGAVVFRLLAQTTPRTVVTDAQLTIIDATGGLEGLHGILEVTGNVYSGEYHFDPS